VSQSDFTNPGGGSIAGTPVDPASPAGSLVSLTPADGEIAGTLGPAQLPAATEGTQGALEISTQPETDTGTDDARAVTPLKLATTVHTKRHVIEFGLGTGVPNGGTRYLDREGVPVSSVPVLLQAAAKLLGITVKVDGAPGAGRTYEARVIADPGGADTLIGSALTLADPSTEGSRRDLSAAIGAGVKWGVSLVRTVGAGASAFTGGRVEVEVQMP